MGCPLQRTSSTRLTTKVKASGRRSVTFTAGVRNPLLQQQTSRRRARLDVRYLAGPWVERSYQVPRRRMSAPASRSPETRQSPSVKSLGHRRSTKVSEERTRGRRAVAMGVCVSGDRAGAGTVPDSGTSVVGFPAAAAPDRPFQSAVHEYIGRIGQHERGMRCSGRWLGWIGTSLRRVQTVRDHDEALSDGVGAAGGARGGKSAPGSRWQQEAADVLCRFERYRLIAHGTIAMPASVRPVALPRPAVCPCGYQAACR